MLPRLQVNNSTQPQPRVRRHVDIRVYMFTCLFLVSVSAAITLPRAERLWLIFLLCRVGTSSVNWRQSTTKCNKENFQTHDGFRKMHGAWFSEWFGASWQHPKDTQICMSAYIHAHAQKQSTSSSRLPVAPVSLTRSEPARSTRLSFPTLNAWPWSSCPSRYSSWLLWGICQTCVHSHRYKHVLNKIRTWKN